MTENTGGSRDLGRWVASKNGEELVRASTSTEVINWLNSHGIRGAMTHYEKASDSREQAIAAGANALCEKWGKYGRDLEAEDAARVLDAAHREGHIFWAHEHNKVTGTHWEVHDEEADENERLRAAIREIDAAVAVWNETGEHFHIFKVVQRLVAGALGDGEEGGRP